MRNELELLELIDRYLKNELSEQENAEFEAKLKADTQLQKEVELQKELLKGIDSYSLRQSAKKAYKRYKLTKAAWVAGIGLAVLIAIAAAVYLYNQNYESDPFHLPELNEMGTDMWSDADRYLPYQRFTINTAKDTVIETEGGMVIAIPANAFTDENGHEISGQIEFEVKEALDPNAIINAGLTTMSNDRLLQTGGMFYMNARSKGKTLQIDKDIYVDVPTDTILPNMQLFNGERRDDGTINWVDPKPMASYLTTVDIHSLNFYPPNFEDSLAAMGYPDKDKSFTDSVFYSFYCGGLDVSFGYSKGYVVKAIGSVPDTLTEKEALELGLILRDTLSYSGSESGKFLESLMEDDKRAYYHYTETEATADLAISEADCGIQPSQIQAIWNDKFQNTLLATKAFEERLQALYPTCQGSLLDLYVNNMDKPLYQLDSMVAGCLSGAQRDRFLAFAAQHKGSVKDGDKLAAKLSEYYTKKQKVYAEAARKTQEDFWKKQHKLDQHADTRTQEQKWEEEHRQEENLLVEFCHNYDEACEQLDYTYCSTLRCEDKIEFAPAPRNYNVTVSSTGWKNLDQYVWEATENRETLNYTDPNTGKKAVIQYLPFTVKVKDAEEYDRIYVYLLTEELYSFQRMKREGNTFTEKLNETLEYQLVCVAYKGDQAYYSFSGSDLVVPLTTLGLGLEKIEKTSLETRLNELKSKKSSNDIWQDLEYQTFKVKDNLRRKKNLEMQEFRRNMYWVVFPCDKPSPVQPPSLH